MPVVDHVTSTAGAANGERVRRWFQDKKAGWYVALADPQIPATSPVLDQAQDTIERTQFVMKSFHYPDGSQQAFLRGLATCTTSYRISGAWRSRTAGCPRAPATPQETGSSRPVSDARWIVSMK